MNYIMFLVNCLALLEFVKMNNIVIIVIEHFIVLRKEMKQMTLGCSESSATSSRKNFSETKLVFMEPDTSNSIRKMQNKKHSDKFSYLKNILIKKKYKFNKVMKLCALTH